ncbi:MAG: hypothetical protein ACE5G6_09670 [Terriglobia bacterium]
MASLKAYLRKHDDPGAGFRKKRQRREKATRLLSEQVERPRKR